MGREDLIHQLSEEMGLSLDKEKIETGYVRATGTMLGDGKEWKVVKSDEDKIEDPWDKLELNPTSFK